jgi:hypothetical protein
MDPHRRETEYRNWNYAVELTLNWTNKVDERQA